MTEHPEENIQPTAAEGNAFDDIACTAQNHFRLNFYAAIFRVTSHVRFLGEMEGKAFEEVIEKYPFLMGYVSEALRFMPEGITWTDGLRWWDEQLLAWEQACPEHLPLRAMLHDGLLPLHSRTAFIIAGLVEEDSRFGTLFADLQAPLSDRRPSLELVGRFFMEEDQTIDPWTIVRPLLVNGFVDVLNREVPRSEWVLRVPDLFWDAIRGDRQAGSVDWYSFHPSATFEEIGQLILSDKFLEKLQKVPFLVESGKVQSVVLRGTMGSERLPVMGALVRALGKEGIIAVTQEAFANFGHRVGPLCTMTGTVPVVTYDLPLGETADVLDLIGYVGPRGLLLGLEGGLRGKAVEASVSLTLPPLRETDRRMHWEKAFGEHQTPWDEEINQRFYLPGGYIQQVATTAVSHAVLEGREEVGLPDVREACRVLNRQLLDTLAEHLDGGDLWANLIVNESAQARLWELEQRCRHRERMLDHLGLGFGSNTNRGVRALFTGPSGTGKTLAAKVLATELGLDLYRVDLASIISKYIGETEKNLHRVLSIAEELDVILLLDEGDALLGNRTDVRSSNDRYANLETNYLLQRLEHYQGIVFVTTNLGENIDRAFIRRMDIVVEFMQPQVEERKHIWYLHLPPRHTVDDLFLQEVASRCEMTGAQIRNAAFLATLLAVEGGRPTMAREDLEVAIRSEYRKAGATCPLSPSYQLPKNQNRVQSFIKTL